MLTTGRRSWLIGLALIYLTMILLVWGTNVMHLRPDENLVYDFTRNDLPYLVTYLAEQDSHPPLWFSSFWGWRQLLGDSEFAGRLLALFCSMITMALVYRIGRTWFGAARFGLFALALLGVNSYFFIYALEIRPYGMIMLLVTTSMWAYQRWLKHQTRRTALIYACTLGLMLYVHYFLFVLMIVQALYFLLRRPNLVLIRQGMIVAGTAVLIWLPWLPFAAYQVLHVRSAELAGGNTRGVLGAGSTTQPTSLSAVTGLAELATNGHVLLHLLIVLIGGLFLWRKANWWLALFWAIAVPAVSLLVNLVIAVFLPRYVVYMIIGLALLVGAGFAVLPARLRLLALLPALALSLYTLPTQLPDDRIPLRDLYRQVSAVALPEDVIFFDNGGLNDGFVRAQVNRYLDRDLWQRRVNSVDEALESRRVWYVSDDEWFSERTRGRFEQIEKSHPLQQVIGSCDRDWCYLIQLLEGAPNSEPVLFGNAVAFLGVDVDSVSADRLTLRLWWTAETTPDLDYSIGVHLLDGEGRLVAQSDSGIIDFYSGEVVQTSQLAPNKIYIDARELTLPPELPAGAYQLRLIVYQSWDNSRLTLPDGTDHLVLETLSLGGA